MSSKNKKGDLIADGKTKVIYSVIGDNSKCIIESKTAITANDDPSLTREFKTKAIAANVTTCNVFEVLKEAGIPVAYEKRLSDTEFLSKKCTMIPLEVIARRYAFGSFLERETSYVEKTRFNDPLIEFFLKTTNGTSVFDKKNIALALPVEDPYISEMNKNTWKLLHPKLPYSDYDSFIESFESKMLIDGRFSISDIEKITERTFLVLEYIWSKCGLKLVDFKIEFGLTSNGKLVVADVIDNDSWRLKTQFWEDLSKQSFRDGEDLSEVERKYLKVMELSNDFELTS
jgi:phosphoribosylaminoimidazole carboxylase/phosphoribosylaminoimidazole-succinocarboxamide synthase